MMEATNWQAICEEYVAGTASYRALAEKYGVDLNALSKQARDGEWGKQRKLRRASEQIVDIARARTPAGEEATRGAASEATDEARRRHARKKRTARRLQRAIRDMDEAAVAAGIRRKALLILDRMFDECAEISGTEQRFVQDGVANVRKLRDMTAIYRELTGGTSRRGEVDVEDLSPLAELLEEEDETV